MQQPTFNIAQPPCQLEGVRIVDLSRILSGPFCTMHLADLGAEVIKVEPPEGDPIRQQGHSIEGLSWYFAAFNRNKRSIRLNLRSVDGMDALRKLIATADVVVDNFRPGVMDKMGLDWDALQSLKPGLIHTSISGFGQSGPYAHRPAFDFVAQGMSGFMSLNGTRETGPLRTGVPISDLIAGTYAALGTVAALMRRNRTGRGERVSAALVDGLLSYGAFSSAHYFATGEVPEPVGNDHSLVAPYGLFTAADGEITIAPSNEGVYNKLMKTLELEHLKEDVHFVTNEARVKNRAYVNSVINEVVRKQTVNHWIEVLNAAGVPTGMVQDLAGAYADPQVVSQDMLIEVEHPGHGKVKMTGFALKFSEAPCQVRLPAPDLGSDSRSVLRELGYADNQIASLAADADRAVQGTKKEMK